MTILGQIFQGHYLANAAPDTKSIRSLWEIVIVERVRDKWKYDGSAHAKSKTPDVSFAHGFLATTRLSICIATKRLHTPT